MNLLNGLDGVWIASVFYRVGLFQRSILTQVVDTGVNTNLVHDGDTGLLALLIKLQHGRADIASGDDVLLGADSGLDDHSVESWVCC